MLEARPAACKVASSRLLADANTALSVCWTSLGMPNRGSCCCARLANCLRSRSSYKIAKYGDPPATRSSSTSSNTVCK
eukprot:3750487-Amphidinium_carterae.2